MKKYIIILIAILGFTSCQDYLDRKNLDTFDESNFWTSENNMRLFAQGAYTAYFTGYGSGFTWGNYFTGGAWSDEYSSGSIWTTTTATSGNGWSFTYVRRANIMIDRVDKMPGTVEAKNHWRGIGRFFRALEYSDLTRAFGDIPWIDKEITPADVEIAYKKRDPLAEVSIKIMEDFEYAAANVRVNDGPMQINRDIVLAFMSRNLLYLGTYIKYHNNDLVTANRLLEKAKWAANEVMASGKYQIVDDYRGLFSSEDLAGNKEVIMYRSYLEAKATHCLLSYNNTEPQTGVTLKMINTYLSNDGLPIKQSPTYNYVSDNGLRFYPDQYKNRDPRMAATFADTIRVNGAHSSYSTTGFVCWKFLPYSVDNSLKYQGSTNTTDAPIIRYAEVLLNYAEAAAELGQFTQSDADKTINLLRNRNIKKNNSGNVLPKLPKFEVSGNDVIANGVVINDPDRDPSVSSLIWEIRRERTTELMFEGFRKNDLRRWKKYEYLKTKEEGVPTLMGIGAYIDFTKFTATQQTNMKKAVKFYYPDPVNQPNKAFIYNLPEAASRRDWQPGVPMYERQYLNAIPLDQIKLYKDLGYELAQNPGWDTI